MEEKKSKKTNDRAYYMFALRIIGDFGVSIAAPVVILVLIGQYYDGKFHSSPGLTILGFVVAALISAKIIYKKSKKYGEEYQKLGSNTEPTKHHLPAGRQAKTEKTEEGVDYKE